MLATLDAGPRNDLNALLDGVQGVATLPQVTRQILKAIEDPNSTPRDLNEIILHDPALVTRILRVVNSAFFGMPGMIGTVERAIVVLGTKGVKNIAIAASLGTLFEGTAFCDGFAPKDLWIHSIAVAVAARELARSMKLGLADESFLAGLIHDIGILVSLQVRPGQFREVCDAAREGREDFCAIERRIIGFDHQELGMGLATRWRFPRSVQLVAGYHHRPKQAADPHRHLLALVHVADTLCCQTRYGFNLTGASQTLENAALAEMRIDPLAVGQTRESLDALVPEAVALLQ